MFRVGCITREQEKLVYGLEETIKEIEGRGKALKQRQDQQIWSIDEEQGESLKVHQNLDKNMSITKTRYYQEKCEALEKDIELLWKKVRAYEYHGDIERNLKNMAVDELTKVKDKLRETFEAGNKTEEGNTKPNPNKEWRTVWKEKEGKILVESGWVEIEKKKNRES
jgi:hypothetical protein